MVRTGISQSLLRRVMSGEYVVDEHAVAEAMLARLGGRRGGSSVLVSRKSLDRRAGGSPEDGAAPRDDLT
jgi:hypothetical protein